MLSQKFIRQVILKMQLCVSDLTAQEIDKIRFGHDDTEKLRNTVLYLRNSVNILKDYIPNPVIDSSKIKFSDKGRFIVNGNSLSLEPKKYKVKPDDINCLKEEQICSLIKTLLQICPNC